MTTPTPKAKIYKPDTSLQSRLGIVTLTENDIKAAEQTVANAQADFTPMATEFLSRLGLLIAAARQDPTSEDVRQRLIQPVMELKANAGMFGYDLVSRLANIMLTFLEGVSKLDAKIVEIVAAHHTTLNLIITRKMSGDGGPVGAQLEAELKAACARYFAKTQPGT